jgi:hypothetical protein
VSAARPVDHSWTKFRKMAPNRPSALHVYPCKHWRFHTTPHAESVDVLRCLKRFIARDVFYDLKHDLLTQSGT